ncbi:MAG: HslU--HslV peptidase ATPase subunit, partial [Pseudomonadales bacterium]|nr:HslU--HslV peptidase ATPase subunit [Pseudomonadales bacterium]
EQYQALLATEGLSLTFTDDGIARVAELAWQVNAGTENIGARRLHTVMERLLESVSFNASETTGEAVHVCVDAAFVDEHLGALVKDQDLSRFIL